MNEKNTSLVKITSTIAGVTFLMVVMVLIFAKHELWIITPIVGFMSLFGIFMGYFLLKQN